jgi:hypothetical protein
MLVVLVGLAVRVTMSADQREQMPLSVFAFGVSAALRQREHLSDIERKVDRHQRVEGEREEAEPRGPNPASPHCPSHSGSPAVILLVRA